MGVSLGLALSRTIVIAFNFIFFALGGLSLGLGIYSYFYGAIGNFISIPPFSIGLMVIGGYVCSALR